MTSLFSTVGLRTMMTANLSNQTSLLALLSQQLSSNQKYSDLTDYAPTDALNLVNYQSAITQQQSYLSSINAVQARLTVYDSSMTDMETVTSTAATLAASNSNYNAATADQIQQQAQSYLQQVGDDLNQKVGDRYIYSGTRYSTQPVSNLTSLTDTVPTTTTTNPAVADYDSSYVGGLTATVSGQTVTIGGTVTTPQNASVTVNGKQYSYAIQSGDTATNIATGLATAVSADIPGTSSSGAVLTVGGTGTVTAAGGDASTAAYTNDSILIGTNYSYSYGASSNDPSFQKMISGLRLISAAVTAGKSGDTATYQTDMNQAATMLSSALSGIQTLHANVAFAQNTMTTATSSINTDITSLQNQTTDITQIDSASVAAQMTQLQTQIEVSYSATSSLAKLSLVNYL